MASSRHAADNLMLTGISHHCEDCGGERVFVTPDCGEVDCGDYACTDCGAAILVEVEITWPASSWPSAVA